MYFLCQFVILCHLLLVLLLLLFDCFSLFSYVDDYYYFSRPTYAAFIRLLDNYNHVIGGAEHSNYEESQEISTFLEAISKTGVMQKTLLFLHQHGLYCRLLPIWQMLLFMFPLYQASDDIRWSTLVQW